MMLQKKREAQGRKNEAPASTGGYGWLSSSWTLVVYTFGAFVAGICAGTVGIGGGLIKGPLMLHMGLHPLSAIATSNFMIFFTSISTTLSFSMAGRLKIWEALLLGSTSFVAALLGLSTLSWAVRKYRCHYVITYLIAVVLSLSLGTVLLTLFFNVY